MLAYADLKTQLGHAVRPGGLGRILERFAAYDYKVRCGSKRRLVDPPPLEWLVAQSPADPCYINNYFFLPGEEQREGGIRNRRSRGGHRAID